MAEPIPTVINGKIPGWSSLEFSAVWTDPDSGAQSSEEIITPIQALSYSDSASVSVAMGAGDLPQGVVDGPYVPGSMSISLFSRYFRQMAKRATRNGAVRLSQVQFRLIVKQRTKGGGPIEVDEIDFRMTEPSDDRKPGGDPNLTVVKCTPILIKRDGVII